MRSGGKRIRIEPAAYSAHGNDNVFVVGPSQ